MTVELILTPDAAAKIFLHVKGSPVSAVLNGILAGKSISEESSGGAAVVFEDAFPCFHTTPTTLNLPLEIYISQVIPFLLGKGYNVFAYYLTNTVLDQGVGMEISKSIEKAISHHVSRKGSQKELTKENRFHYYHLNVDSSVVRDLENETSLGLSWSSYNGNNGNFESLSWKHEISTFSSVKEYKGCLASIVSLKDSLVDFDDHLDDVSKDWTNKHLTPHLKKRLEQK